jgi:EAL domain-containing protein (putative c-di-GMP-specific phosphodiesterase class I)
LPLSVLKIDRSFIEQLCAPNGMYTTLNIVQAIVSMSHALHQKVVAEGVETEAQLACLGALDCDLVQGFHLSRPLVPEDVPAIAAQKHPAFAHLSPSFCSTPLLDAAAEPISAD